MSTNIVTVWGSWTTTSINSSSITNTSTATTSGIDNSNKSGTEVAISVTYGSGTCTQGIDVLILRDVAGTYESANDRPFGFQMPYQASSSYKRTISVMADRVSKFEVYINNQSGVTCTVTVQYKQATVQAS